MADLKTYFRELGERTEKRWSAQKYDLDAFPGLARTILQETPAHASVDPLELLKLVVRTKSWSNHGTKDAFGQPGIAVWSSPRFQIEVLYWFEGTTQIHQHAFAGAFQVLTGSSVHGRYSFAISEKINAELYLGDTRLDDIDLLRRGDTCEIHPGWKLNHLLFHLDHPSTTVVIRTHVRPEHLPQLSLFRPHLAFADYTENHALSIRLRALTAAAQMDPESLDPLAEEAMTGVDARSLYMILSHYLGLSRDAGRSLGMIDRMRALHGAKVDMYVKVVDEYRRSMHIMARRARVRGAEHRFFMALLLTCPDRRTILKLVGDRFPEGDPAQTVARWIGELGDDPSAETYEPLRR